MYQRYSVKHTAEIEEGEKVVQVSVNLSLRWEGAAKGLLSFPQLPRSESLIWRNISHHFIHIQVFMVITSTGISLSTWKIILFEFFSGCRTNLYFLYTP